MKIQSSNPIRFGQFTSEQQTQLATTGLPLDQFFNQIEDRFSPFSDYEKEGLASVSEEGPKGTVDKLVQKSGVEGFEALALENFTQLPFMLQFVTQREAAIVGGKVLSLMYEDLKSSNYTPSEKVFNGFKAFITQYKQLFFDKAMASKEDSQN